MATLKEEILKLLSEDADTEGVDRKPAPVTVKGKSKAAKTLKPNSKSEDGDDDDNDDVSEERTPRRGPKSNAAKVKREMTRLAKKKANKAHDGVVGSKHKKMHEDLEPVNEISKKLVLGYLNKSTEALETMRRKQTGAHAQTTGGINSMKQMKTKLKRVQGIGRAVDRYTGTSKVKMSEEMLDELSKKTLGNYVKKAAVDMADKGSKSTHEFSLGMRHGAKDVKRSNFHVKRSMELGDKMRKRQRGINKAVDRLTKESLTEGELSQQKSYFNRAKGHSTKIGAMLDKLAKSDKHCWMARDIARDLENIHDRLDSHVNPDPLPGTALARY